MGYRLGPGTRFVRRIPTVRAPSHRSSIGGEFLYREEFPCQESDTVLELWIRTFPEEVLEDLHGLYEMPPVPGIPRRLEPSLQGLLGVSGSDDQQKQGKDDEAQRHISIPRRMI